MPDRRRTVRAYVYITGALFAIIAIVHMLRLALSWPAEIAGWTVPDWISWVAVFVTVALSGWAFRLATRKRKGELNVSEEEA